MGVDASALADLLATTLRDLPKGEFEAMWDNQHYEFARIYAEERREVDGGTSIQRNVIFDEDGSAAYRRLYDTDSPTVTQNQKVINVPWTQFSFNYSWDELELMRNKNSAKGFIDLIQSRRTRALWSAGNLMETRGWLTPTSATDTLFPYGIPYYVNFLDDGSTTDGFNAKTVRYQGGTTGTIVAGIDGAVEPKWRNYAAVYTRVDNALLRKMRSAVRRTRFQPAKFMMKPGNDKWGANACIYVNDDTCTELEDLSDKRDDNNTPDDLSGKMLHNFEGTAHFNRMPIKYVPQLDGFTVTGGSATVNTVDPIFCIDWTKLQPIVQEGYWMVEKKPMVDRGQHTTFTVFNDSCHQNLCINRRTAGWVIHKGIVA